VSPSRRTGAPIDGVVQADRATWQIRDQPATVRSNKGAACQKEAMTSQSAMRLSRWLPKKWSESGSKIKAVPIQHTNQAFPLTVSSTLSTVWVHRPFRASLSRTSTGNPVKRSGDDHRGPHRSPIRITAGCIRLPAGIVPNPKCPCGSERERTDHMAPCLAHFRCFP
jgi:hypothetical protein